jgi:hypothetical protein
MVSLAAWGLLSLVGLVWHPLHARSAATILFAAAIGCFANGVKNRTYHCSMTSWIFLAGAVAFSADRHWRNSNRTTLRLGICGGRNSAFVHSRVAVRDSTREKYMNVTEKGAPAAAIVAALSTLACCLPLGFLGAVGLAGLSLWARQYGRGMLLASIALLCVGSV